MFLNQVRQLQNSIKFVETPIGTLTIKCSYQGVYYIRIKNSMDIEENRGDIAQQNAIIVQQQLEEYFSGMRNYFDVPLDLSRKTPFQKVIYQELLKTCKGYQTTYKELAHQIGYNSYQAVGQALAKNDILIIIPCHRVVGNQGQLTGFVDGIENKQQLLQFEQQQNQIY